MIDPHAKLMNYLRLLALVVILGAVSAVITFIFITFVNKITRLNLGPSPIRYWNGSPPVHVYCVRDRRTSGWATGQAIRRP